MKLFYLSQKIAVHFAEPIFFDTDAIFLFRSVLGFNLKALCCVATHNVCASCLYNRTCGYAWLFEGIVPKDNRVIPNRNRAPHPLVIRHGAAFDGRKAHQDFSFDLILLGKAAEYFPYIYGALTRAGEKGLGRRRVPFAVERFAGAGGSDNDGETGDESGRPEQRETSLWQTNVDGKRYGGAVLVQLETPLRFKAGGRYALDFSAKDFFLCLDRRMRTLCAFYGESDFDETPYRFRDGEIEITEKNLRWLDTRHYSARQKKAMALGGALGTFALDGVFSERECDALEFAKLFSAGKNTNFGLGKMDYWTKLREL